jgi:putative addiction module component (TIGR02574 family)
MTSVAERLKRELAALPVDDRAELAAYLIRTLDSRTDPDAEAAWDVELQRRVEEIRSGVAVGEPADDVFARLRARIS